MESGDLGVDNAEGRYDVDNNGQSVRCGQCNGEQAPGHPCINHDEPDKGYPHQPLEGNLHLEGRVKRFDSRGTVHPCFRQRTAGSAYGHDGKEQVGLQVLPAEKDHKMQQCHR